MTTRAKEPRAPRRIEARWGRWLGGGLLASSATAGCMLIDYERAVENSRDFPTDADVVITATPTDIADAGPDANVNTPAISDSGTAADSGDDAEALTGCDPATYIADSSCGVGYCRTTNQPSSCFQGVETACLPGAPLASSDTTCDGVDDDCDGLTDDDVPSSNSACGVGACAATGTRTCQAGTLIDSCTPGVPLASSDTTCDGVDDDCDGLTDEDVLPSSSACGVGACAATGTRSCQAGALIDSCVPGLPLANDTAASGVGIDDDCDGVADEDEPCDTTPRVFTPGSYAALSVPLNCTQLSVRLWGGAGAGGQLEGVLFQPGGRGGAGGYAESTLTLASGQQLDLMVGAGAAAGCGAGGSSTSAGFGGGSGGTGVGADGEDGLQSGGGTGATPSSGPRGGNGYRGGGGGGAGSPVIGLAGSAGGGGAASAFFVAGAPVLLAGGGGGGGGAASLILGVLGVAGGDGGVGCSGNGATANANGGGGGGGGACLGTVIHAGTNVVPFDAASLPANQARGGPSSCGAGGGGYAILSFAP